MGIGSPFAAAKASSAAISARVTLASAPESPCPKLVARAEKSVPFTADVNRKSPWSQLVWPVPKFAARMLKSEPFTVPSRFASPSSVYLISICPEVIPETIPSAPSAQPTPYLKPFVGVCAVDEINLIVAINFF